MNIVLKLSTTFYCGHLIEEFITVVLIVIEDFVFKLNK